MSAAPASLVQDPAARLAALRARMSADQNAMVTQMYVREGKKYDGA